MNPLLLVLALLLPSHADDRPRPLTAAEAQVVSRLSMRHDDTPCDTYIADLPRPADSLAHLAEHVGSPPWVGIRAARCRVALAASAPATADPDPVLLAWVTDPDLAGLAGVVLARVHTLPEPHRRPLAAAALAGPLADDARRALATSPDAALRALATPPTPGAE